MTSPPSSVRVSRFRSRPLLLVSLMVALPSMPSLPVPPAFGDVQSFQASSLQDKVAHLMGTEAARLRAAADAQPPVESLQSSVSVAASADTGGMTVTSGSAGSGGASASSQSTVISNGLGTTIDTKVQTESNGVTKSETRHVTVPSGSAARVHAATSTDAARSAASVEYVGSGTGNGNRAISHVDGSLGPPPAATVTPPSVPAGFFDRFFQRATRWFTFW